MTDLTGQEFKMEQQSPTQNIHFPYSRTSSTGSVHAISCSSASSAHNTGKTIPHRTYTSLTHRPVVRDQSTPPTALYTQPNFPFSN